MTKTLADLVVELQEDVPAVDGVPSEAQYERAIKDAVREFSRRCGLVKVGTLSIVANTASYALADDFLDLIELESVVDVVDGVIITATGIIPVSADWEEIYTIAAGTITFYPTPTYTSDRDYTYKAAWILDVNDAYSLTDEEAQIVMLKAKGLCFDKLANAGVGGFKYSVGNMSVDKSGMGESYTKRQYELHGEFTQACERYNGAVLR